jgi:hypothetical protein
VKLRNRDRLILPTGRTRALRRAGAMGERGSTPIVTFEGGDADSGRHAWNCCFQSGVHRYIRSDGRAKAEVCGDKEVSMSA